MSSISKEPSIKIIKVKDWVDKIEEITKIQGFMVGDTVGLLSNVNPDSIIVYIYNYTSNNPSQDEKKNMLQNVVSGYEGAENYLILTSAYVSLDEFPEDKYYDPYIKNENIEGKKEIPFDEVIERESKLLESIGFVDFNDYVSLEFSKAYVYNNKLAQDMFNYIKNVVQKGE